MLGQWTLELNHVAAIVGGFNTQEKYVGQEGVVYSPVPKTRQEAAVKFLIENAFATPQWAIDPQVLRRIEPIGALSRIRNAQSSVLNNLMNSARFARIVEQEAIDGASAYGPTQLLADVRKGIWRELDAPQVRIDPYRRNLQRAYLDLVNTKLNTASPALPANLPPGFPVSFFSTSGDERPFYRAELKTLNSAIGGALAKTADPETRAHLDATSDQIAKILDPKFAPPSGSAAGTIRVLADQLDPFLAPADQLGTCWPDYVIRP